MAENFKYESLKSNPPLSVPEGDFAYEHSSLKIPAQEPDGSFDFKKVALGIPDAGTELLPMLITWGTFYWGGGDTWGRVVEVREVGADFTYDRPKVQAQKVEEGGFEFEHIRAKTGNPEESGDFSYKRF